MLGSKELNCTWALFGWDSHVACFKIYGQNHALVYGSHSRRGGKAMPALCLALERGRMIQSKPRPWMCVEITLCASVLACVPDYHMQLQASCILNSWSRWTSQQSTQLLACGAAAGLVFSVLWWSSREEKIVHSLGPFTL